MSDVPQSPHALFLENLPLVERIAGSLAARTGLRGDDADDFASWIKLRLIEDDYAAFRKFRGESAIGTYLTVVLAMLARDYRVQRWGRWRPSAAARRLGGLAVRLETLVRGQGYRLDEAAEVLRSAGETEQTDRELAGLLARLPARAPLRPREVGADALDLVEAGAAADVLVSDGEAGAERHAVERALEAAMRPLSTEDRLVLRLRFWEGLSVAEIARALSLEQKPLYRRIERLLRDLRRSLTGSGVTPEQIRELLDAPLDGAPR